MSEEHFIDDIRAVIEKTAEEFFSGGILSDKTALALKLAALPGLDFYSTAVPWRINLPKDGPIVGYSETLRFAAKDIHAQLVRLTKAFPPGTTISIGIDEARLPTPRQPTVLKKSFEGG